MRFLPFAISIAFLVFINTSSFEAHGAEKHLKQTKYIVYVGSYGTGIQAYRFDAGDGQLQAIGMMGKITNPSFLIADREFRYLYAVSELTGKEEGAVASFAINPASGALSPLNSVSSAGLAPCHLAVDQTSKMLMVANYTSGGVSVYPIKDDGHIGEMTGVMTAHGKGPNRERQEGPHAHEVVVTSDNRFAYVPDLGLDHVRIYKIDSSHAALTANNPAFTKQDPGMGPRHMAFSPDEKFAYVVNELKSEVSVFQHDKDTGALTKIQDVSTLPPDYSGENGPAEILVDSAGKFVYATNRGADSIAVFAIDPTKGTLRQIQVISSEGTMPRGLEIDPTGHFVFAGNQKTDNFVIFHIDANSGKLAPTGQVIQTPSPVAFLFVPTS
jgi:6-phosphogluconolactonase